MGPECRSITLVIIPAIRASVAEQMQKKYRYKQAEIARKLGIVQVAVSKYLNGKYSREVSRVKEYITRHGLETEIAEGIARNEDEKSINSRVDALCGRIAKELSLK